MKKLISMILAVIMLVLPMGVLADSSTSAELEKVLITVKTKITVPAGLTVFSSYVRERNGKTYYNLDWTNGDYGKSLSVSCDSEGRIIGYNDYTKDTSDKKIPSFSRDEIVRFASLFIQKTLPETNRGEGDVLVYDAESYSADGNLRYSMRFDRRKEMVKVKDNYADITVCEIDGELVVRNMSVSYDYDTEFETSWIAPGSVWEDIYMKQFPAELIYRNEYNYYAPKGMPKTTPVLVYRIKDDNIGYIDVETNEIITEDAGDNGIFNVKAGVTEDSASGGSSRNDILAPEEIAELEKIDGLMSEDDIKDIVKKLPYVNLTDDMELKNSSLYKNIEENYIYDVSYSKNEDDDYRRISVSADAKTGKILSLYANYGYGYSEKTLSEAQIKNAENKIAEFLNAVAKDELGQCEEKDNSVYSTYVSENYVRFVNGIKYINNGINVNFDAEHNTITSFNLNFTKAEFENPENAIGEEAAYRKILEYAPITSLYIKSGGVYRWVYTLDCYSMQINAVTGEAMDGYVYENKNYSYSDIENHWVKESAEKLAEIQIGFDGDMLNPEACVTQEELLRFLASGIYSKYYAEYSEEDLYEHLINNNILTEEEKSPESLVTREQSFVYIIRFANLERVAKLSDIYKVSYADGNLLSEGKIGYAAILSGLEIICGSGGKLRPQNNLTRAEAITMMYRYLVNM